MLQRTVRIPVMTDNGKIWADGEDPFADFRKTLRRKTWIAMKHGHNTREYFEEVRRQGLFDQEEEKNFAKLAESESAESPRQHIAAAVTPKGAGGMAVSIGFNSGAYKQDGINAAIKSLGDRTGDDLKTISADLKRALRERDLRLDKDIRLQIAATLAEGKEVVVGVDSD